MLRRLQRLGLRPRCAAYRHDASRLRPRRRVVDFPHAKVHLTEPEAGRPRRARAARPHPLPAGAMGRHRRWRTYPERPAGRWYGFDAVLGWRACHRTSRSSRCRATRQAMPGSPSRGRAAGCCMPATPISTAPRSTRRRGCPPGGAAYETTWPGRPTRSGPTAPGAGAGAGALHPGGGVLHDYPVGFVAMAAWHGNVPAARGCHPRPRQARRGVRREPAGGGAGLALLEKPRREPCQS